MTPKPFLSRSITVLVLMTFNLLQAADGKLPSPLQTALEDYSKIQSALATDSLKGAAEASASLSESVQNDKTGFLPIELKSQALTLSKSSDLKTARNAFKPLSATLIALLSSQPAKSGRYFEANCPMAAASWIQTDKPIKNPYYGSSMLTCGSIEREL